MPRSGSRAAGSSFRRTPPFQIVITRGGNAKTLTMRPWLLRTLGFGSAGLLALCLMAGAYFVFHDDLLAVSIARQEQMRAAYENRLAVLRADLDRLTSRLVLDRQAFDNRLDKLLTRQAALDERQDIIAGLSQAARRTGFVIPEAERTAPGDTSATGGPLTTGSITPAEPGQRAQLAFAALRPSHAQVENFSDETTERMDAAAARLDVLAEKQVAYVAEMANGVGERAARIETVLAKLGHRLPGTAGVNGGTGGPYVPLAADADPDTFRRNVDLIAYEFDRLSAARKLASALPLARPARNASISSRFGTRIDPFLGRPALHTGIDFRVPMGFPVRSTAPGTVTAAEYNGGYGNMVEIDHGNGVTTRFGHLSRILATIGEQIPTGTVIGRAGSTGRSTGPHLHYEIRVDGKAINPMRYLHAGAEIKALL